MLHRSGSFTLASSDMLTSSTNCFWLWLINLVHWSTFSTGDSSDRIILGIDEESLPTGSRSDDWTLTSVAISQQITSYTHWGQHVWIKYRLWNITVSVASWMCSQPGNGDYRRNRVLLLLHKYYEAYELLKNCSSTLAKKTIHQLSQWELYWAICT